MIDYVNTSPAALLATHPRAVYRVTLERSGISSLSFSSGWLSWPGVVEETVSAIGRSPYGVPLGYPRPASQDLTAVVEVRAPSAPSTGDSVGDLARAADDASSYTRVTRIERLPPVPAFSDTTATATRATTREAEAARAAEAARENTLTERIDRAIARVGTAGAVALGVVALIGAVWVFGTLRGGSVSWR